MKNFAKTTTLLIMAFAVTPAMAQTKIDELCGQGHINERLSPEDVVTNPDGYYVQSLEEQLSHGDPRIINAVGDEFHFCTRNAATPDMDANRALRLMEERRVKYLFVPCPKKQEKPAS